MKLSFRLILGLSVVLAAGLLLVLSLSFYKAVGKLTLGMTFSASYTRYLGLDPHEVFEASLNELPMSVVRLPVEWSQIQPERSENNFSDLDWYLDQAAQHQVKVVLAVGNKVPRWPECYTPGWVKDLPATEYQTALLDYLDTLVRRYRLHPALERWQVENESTFVFGDCPAPDFDLVKREIEKVKALDPDHHVQLTVSGEQQLWVSMSKYADVIGTSMYRQVALPNGFKFVFPIPPLWYRLQAALTAPWVKQVVVSELQAEPWLTKDYRTYATDEANRLFTPQQLRSYVRYARRTGIQEISVWGVEWWYYLKNQGYPELWETGKLLAD